VLIAQAVFLLERGQTRETETPCPTAIFLLTRWLGPSKVRKREKALLNAAERVNATSLCNVLTAFDIFHHLLCVLWRLPDAGVIVGSKSLSWKYSMGQKNGLHASITQPKVNQFGWNLAEQGERWAKRWGLALADFERDSRSSDSLRGSLIFCQVNNARFSRFPVGKIYDISTQQRRSVRRWKRSE